MPPRQVKGSIYPEHSELAAALASCRGALLATGLISGMSNVLMLTGAIFVSVRRGRLADRVLV
jgi:ABC-type protease/lipase transport system fused ATPase/permease subunit